MLDIRVFIGRLTRDPEVTVFGEDAKLARITVAVDSDRKNANGERTTEFVDCKAWGSSATFVENYLSKGRLVAIVGRSITESWEDKNYSSEDGKPLTRYKTVVYVDTIYPLDSRKETEADPSEDNVRQASKPASKQPVKPDKVKTVPTW